MEAHGAGGEVAVERPRVHVDTDIALGAWRGDVDDGFALAALLLGDVDILGVSTVFGNTAEPVARGAARRLLAVRGRTVAVARGAARAGDRDTEAARAIAALPAGTRVLALGPLTNVAAALALDPTVAERVELSFVGGNLRSRGRWPPWWPFEFNLAKDVTAARAVFAAPMARRMYPLDCCARLRFGARDLRFLADGGPVARHLARHGWRWLAYTPMRYASLTFPVWDLVPALDVLGLLEPQVEALPLAMYGRGGVRRAPGEIPTVVVRSFDARAKGRALTLLRAG
jgi:inosine-uridine nucleoside N-ribohydrolase